MEGNTYHTSGDQEREQQSRAAACRALGIDPDTAVWPVGARVESEREIPGAADVHLADTEWMRLAPLLPAEAPQLSAMTNRAFLDAVLAAMQRGGAWTTRAIPTAEIDAVRRRFGRWAHQGIFETLQAALPTLALEPETKRLLALAGRRAASLKARAAGPR